jgi:hypothetical protein
MSRSRAGLVAVACLGLKRADGHRVLEVDATAIHLVARTASTSQSAGPASHGRRGPCSRSAAVTLYAWE